jgi:hypothetical protein
MKTMNRERAKELAGEVRAQEKECYRNSVLSLYRFGESEGAEYVEGILKLTDFGIYINHGWVEVGDQIIDVTLDECAPEHYVGVFRYNKAQVDKLVRRKRWLPFYAHEKDGNRVMMEKEWELWKETASGAFDAP